MQPKTPKRRSAFRRANRPMPRRRIDIAMEAIDYKNPDLLKKFVSRKRQNSSSSRDRHACIHAPENHPRDRRRSRSVLLMKSSAAYLAHVHGTKSDATLRLWRPLAFFDQVPELTRFAQLRVLRNRQFAAEGNPEVCFCARHDGL